MGYVGAVLLRKSSGWIDCGVDGSNIGFTDHHSVLINGGVNSRELGIAGRNHQCTGLLSLFLGCLRRHDQCLANGPLPNIRRLTWTTVLIFPVE
eukprot:jgi/Psemu1/301571/fgenesh1_kg.39_\